jgi:hypothetical protein
MRLEFAILNISELNGKRNSQSVWEEYFLLIDADTEAEATKKAEELGRDTEHEYLNSDKELVRWRFEKVTKIYPIEASKLSSGTEVFSRFLKDQTVKSLLQPFED